MKAETHPSLLGLVAGLGVGAGIFYYRSLVQAHFALGLSPRLLMVHADVRKALGLATARETRQLADYLAGLLRQLAGGGAEIATIPAFAPQVCAKELAERTPLPLISLLDAIVTEVERRRLCRVAILGARVTMETSLFGSLRNVTEVVSPRERELAQVGAIYARVVENERACAEDFAALRSLAHALIEREHLDAILLAGTDLSLVFHPGNIDFPHLDGARTHIEAIMQAVTGGLDPRFNPSTTGSQALTPGFADLAAA
ncbi:MAG TPA: aspartate/glutamate racemase family protein [Steroidobacteraceae bacterium]|jgi:aspartate racemase